jgi:hypothetical protein
MKKSTIFFLIIVLCFGIINYTKADEPKRIAQATMSFLNIDVGARAIGMGGAFVSMDKDASALFWNPAGIAKIKGGALSLNHTQWLADTKQYAIAATLGPETLGIPLLGTFGVSFMLMDNGELERTEPVDLSVDPKGYIVGETFNVNQFAVGIAYGHEISDKFSVGGQIKYAYQDLGSADVLIQTVEKADTLQDEKNQEGTIALDFGTIYYTGFKDLRLAMSFRNFASSVKYAYESYELPLTFKVGLAMNVLSLMGPEDGIHSLEVAVDAVRPRDYTERIHLGAEYWFKDLFAIRAGYKFNYDEGGFSAGLGLNPSISGLNFKFDYAYTSFGEIFGSVQRISFGFSF